MGACRGGLITSLPLYFLSPAKGKTPQFAIMLQVEDTEASK